MFPVLKVDICNQQSLNRVIGNSLAVQWLGLHAFTAMGPGSIPGRGTKISQAAKKLKSKIKN